MLTPFWLRYAVLRLYGIRRSRRVMVVPLTLLLPGVFHFGSDGVFIAEPVSNVIGGTACMVTMLSMVLPELRKME